MDKGAIKITLIIIVLIILPFLIYGLFKVMKRRKLREMLDVMSEKEKAEIREHEIWENCYIIGIDNVSKKLIYLYRKKERESANVINLYDVIKCRIATTDTSQKNQYGDKKPANRLDLVMSYRDPSIPETALEFFCNPNFMPSADDFSIIQKWSDIIDAKISRGTNQ